MGFDKIEIWQDFSFVYGVDMINILARKTKIMAWKKIPFGFFFEFLMNNQISIAYSESTPNTIISILLHFKKKKNRGTQIWVGQGCATRASKPIPIFRGHFGRKWYPFLRIVPPKWAYFSKKNEIFGIANYLDGLNLYINRKKIVSKLLWFIIQTQ